MNQLTIIGNLTRDPETRVTTSGVSVCSFTVAVNRRRQQQEGQPEADFFSVSAWRQLGENCKKYLAKGRRVCVVGSVSCRTYTANDGTTRASMEINATDVEFLSSKNEDDHSAPTNPAVPAQASASSPAPAYVAKQTSLQHPGNMDKAEQAYIAAEREAIRNESKYVVVEDGELPF